jgi:nitrous-oxide reductase
VRAGNERVERNGNKVTIYATAIRSHFSPEVIEVKVGDEISTQDKISLPVYPD